VENESPQIKSEEQNIIVDKESERSENIDNKEIKKSAEASAVKPSLTDYISNSVESELYRSSMDVGCCTMSESSDQSSSFFDSASFNLLTTFLFRLFEE
jgi:hypothetical protein